MTTYVPLRDSPNGPPASWGLPPVLPVRRAPTSGPPEAQALLERAATADGPMLARLARQLESLAPDATLTRVVERLVAGTLAFDAALDLFTLRRGPAVVALLRAFPGPLLQDPFEHDAPPWTAADLSLVAKALGRLGPDAVAVGAAHGLSKPTREARLVAVLLAERTRAGGVPSLLVQRVMDADPRVAYTAASVLRRLLGADLQTPAAADVADQLRRALVAGTEEQARGAMRAAAMLPHRLFVLPLIRLLGGPLDEEAQHTLVAITRQRPGRSRRAWTRWWEAHETACRTEWLMEAVDRDDGELAREAVRDLHAITGVNHALPASATRVERRACAAAWEEWWTGARGERSWP
ncbi:MAG: hypothetical protein HY904_19115 [Deltaproteobacteria bacterium]|nr:hypothetical protein [Deltaproteobacteria bacterium]